MITFLSSFIPILNNYLFSNYKRLGLTLSKFDKNHHDYNNHLEVLKIAKTTEKVGKLSADNLTQ